MGDSPSEIVLKLKAANPWHFGDLLVNPGDLADSLTILNIKREMIELPGNSIQDAICRSSLLMDLILKQFDDEIYNQFMTLQSHLFDTNRRQWDLEDQVRSEKTGEAAVAARKNNNERIKIKNEINQLLGYPIEIKQYAEPINLDYAEYIIEG